MALLTTFELLVKRIAPTPGGPANPSNAPFRRIVQGYFLTISHIPDNNSAALPLKMRFTTNIVNQDVLDPNNRFYRGLIGSTLANSNHSLVVDNAGAQTTSLLTALAVLPSSQQFDSNPFTIQPGQTISVALFPNVGNPFVLSAENLAVRGYAEILTVNGQAAGEQLLISAEQRGTLLDNDYPVFNNADVLDFDQIAYSLPLAGGGALIKI
ncbi:hypothetical protein [Fibrella aquatica]|jgi:hypothetical protein|uniref:hypothetical protein n=1 Tax=Fibrella aquatica TaxID=3242487 RepID=UPI00351FC19D